MILKFADNERFLRNYSRNLKRRLSKRPSILFFLLEFRSLIALSVSFVIYFKSQIQIKVGINGQSSHL